MNLYVNLSEVFVRTCTAVRSHKLDKKHAFRNIVVHFFVLLENCWTMNDESENSFFVGIFSIFFAVTDFYTIIEHLI